MKKIVFLFLLFFIVSGSRPIVQELQLYSLDAHPPGKKVVLFVVDSLLDEPLQTFMKQNQLPAFAFLARQGWYTNRMISSFPTMSVTIESSLLTGSYADQHRIPALRWYDETEKRYVNYGDGLVPTARTGIAKVMMDSLYHLNNTHLGKEVSTIHEELADRGMSSASINALIYRGDHPQSLRIPGLYRNVETFAPPYFVLGSFHSYLQSNIKEQVFHYYGVNDQVAFNHLLDLMERRSLPSFTVVYLPDLDHEAHQHGQNLPDSLIRLDRRLQQILNAFGSWEQALKDHVFILLGDSGVVHVKEDKQEAIVDLDERLKSFRIAELGQTKFSDQLAIAVNERMAYVYPLHSDIKEKEIVERLREDARLDTISWKEGDWMEVIQGGTLKRMRFRPGSQYTDMYGQQWDMEGDGSVMDLQVDEGRKRLDYGNYPDGLMRLYSAGHSHEGRFVTVTAKPGYELKGVHSPNHAGGGSHGSFHAEDSYIPMLIAGTDKKPDSLRIVDLKSFILDVILRK